MLGEFVVAVESAFEAGDDGGPDAEVGAAAVRVRFLACRVGRRSVQSGLAGLVRCR